MKKNELQTLVLKVSQLACFLLGTGLVVFNLFSFKVDRYGYFFVDTNQTWLAIGVSLFVLGYFVRNWKKI